MALITKGKPTNAAAVSKQRVIINLITDALFQLSQTSIHPPASSQIFKFGPYQPLSTDAVSVFSVLLRVLGVSVVRKRRRNHHHGDTENTEKHRDFKLHHHQPLLLFATIRSARISAPKYLQ